MSAHTPRLYLNTPLMFEPKPFADELARALDAGDVACVRLRLKGATSDEMRFAIDAILPICHSREAALVVTDHWRLAKEAGLDGVHLEQDVRQIKDARALLGADAIIGAFCGASRHMGMTAAEQEASYVTFGPIVPDPALGSGEAAPIELFEWWQQMIEVPVVAEGGITADTAQRLAPHADFIAAGGYVWKHEAGAAAAVSALTSAIAQSSSQ